MLSRHSLKYFLPLNSLLGTWRWRSSSASWCLNKCQGSRLKYSPYSQFVFVESPLSPDSRSTEPINCPWKQSGRTVDKKFVVQAKKKHEETPSWYRWCILVDVSLCGSWYVGSQSRALDDAEVCGEHHFQQLCWPPPADLHQKAVLAKQQGLQLCSTGRGPRSGSIPRTEINVETWNDSFILTVFRLLRL